MEKFALSKEQSIIGLIQKYREIHKMVVRMIYELDDESQMRVLKVDDACSDDEYLHALKGIYAHSTDDIAMLEDAT